MKIKVKRISEEFDEVEIGPDIPLYTTGVVCRVIGIPIWVLKQLDSEGIVSPPRSNLEKARLYSKRELKLVEHCWGYIKVHKVNVAGLKIILKMEKGV